MLGTFVYLNIIGPFITTTTVLWAVAISVITDGRGLTSGESQAGFS